MEYIIENDNFIVKSQNRGAELISVFNKKYNYEYIWQAGELWTKHSPILFPIVGDLKNNQIQIEQQTYAMTKHGFARDCEFKMIEQTTNTITYELLANEYTKKIYPYDFVFFSQIFTFLSQFKSYF